MKFLKIKTFTSTVTIRHLVSPRQSNAEPPGNHDIYKSNWSQRVSITVRVRSSIWAGAPKKEMNEESWDGGTPVGRTDVTNEEPCFYIIFKSTYHTFVGTVGMCMRGRKTPTKEELACIHHFCFPSCGLVFGASWESGRWASNIIFNAGLAAFVWYLPQSVSRLVWLLVRVWRCSSSLNHD